MALRRSAVRKLFCCREAPVTSHWLHNRSANTSSKQSARGSESYDPDRPIRARRRFRFFSSGSPYFFLAFFFRTLARPEFAMDPQQAPARGVILCSAANSSLRLHIRKHMYELPTYTPAFCKFSFCEVLLIMTVCGWKCAKNTQFSTHETHLLFSASWPEWGEQ